MELSKFDLLDKRRNHFKIGGHIGFWQTSYRGYTHLKFVLGGSNMLLCL